MDELNTVLEDNARLRKELEVARSVQALTALNRGAMERAMREASEWYVLCIEARTEAVKWYKRCLEVLQSTDTWPYDKMPLYCMTCGLTLGDSMICHRCGK